MLLGHAGVMVQARQLGSELYVGVHSNEEITKHKGDPVMNMKERYYQSAHSGYTSQADVVLQSRSSRSLSLGYKSCA